MRKLILLLSAVFTVGHAHAAKEIALSFDDSPVDSTGHFDSLARTQLLIQKLKELNVPPVLLFANPCKGWNREATLRQIKLYKDAGHIIGNHSCSHPRLADVGFEAYSKDVAQADRLLHPFFAGQKFFRFPFLNEGELVLRDQMRGWMKANGYRNGMVSVDNDDYIVSFKINQALNSGKKFDLKKVEPLFLEHLMGAVEFYDRLAVKTLGYSPKHVILLHEMDATVMFIDELVTALRESGWKIISAEEAYQDPMYLEQPANIYAGNGIIAQIHKEKTGEVEGYFEFENLKAKLDQVLGL